MGKFVIIICIIVNCLFFSCTLIRVNTPVLSRDELKVFDWKFKNLACDSIKDKKVIKGVFVRKNSPLPPRTQNDSLFEILIFFETGQVFNSFLLKEKKILDCLETLSIKYGSLGYYNSCNDNNVIIEKLNNNKDLLGVTYIEFEYFNEKLKKTNFKFWNLDNQLLDSGKVIYGNNFFKRDDSYLKYTQKPYW